MDFSKFKDNQNLKFNSFIKELTQEVKTSYDSESWTFENTKDYLLFQTCMKKNNEHLLNVISDYHSWLTENFIVSPKNQ